MPKKYTTVEVTQADIDRATRNHSARCVVATAIARSIDGARSVSIDAQTVRFTVDDERRIYLTPPAAVGYVIAFDAGDTLHPFAFRLSENYRVAARREKRTAAGKERLRVSGIAKRAEAKADQAKAKVVTETNRARATVARQDAAAAVAAAEQAKAIKAETDAALAGEPHWVPDHSADPDTGGRKRKAPPQTYKQATRSYGHRQLRINQAPDTPDEQAARGAVTAEYDRYK